MKEFDYENRNDQNPKNVETKKQQTSKTNSNQHSKPPHKTKLPHITHSSTQKDLLGLLFLACPASPGIRGRDTVTKQWANLNDQKSTQNLNNKPAEDNFDLLLAAAYVSDAHLDLEEFGLARAIQSTKFKRNCFFFYRSNLWKYSLYIIWFSHVVCTWFEQPYIAFSVDILSTNQTNPRIGQRWPTGSEFINFTVSPTVLIINTLAIMFYWADTLLKGIFCGWQQCFMTFQASKNLFYHKEEDDEKLRKRGIRKSSTTLLWIQVQFVTTIFMTIDLITLFVQKCK